MNEQLCRARIAHNAQTREPSLDLSHLDLTSLPETIGELTHLEVLDVRYNYWRQLPSEFANLTKLRSLDLSFFNLDTIPEWLDQLTSLEELHIRATPTTGIPTVLTRLPRLQKLNLYLDGFEALPRELLDLPTLYMLDIDGLEKLTTFPAWLSELPIKHLVYYPRGISNEHMIDSMTMLEELDLQYDHRKPTAFPSWLRQMHNLRWLCYQSQTLVPTWLIELPRLAYLESYGDFSEISQVWHAWESLEQLKCGHISAPAFPPNLKTLELMIKQETFPEAIRSLRHLEELQLSGEGFHELPGWVLELPNLHTLDIVSTRIDHILPPVQPNHCLRKLMMHSLFCSHHHTLDGIRSLHRLEKLSLGGHTLEQLPSWLHELQQLRELSIDDCALTDLDPRLGQLQQLEALHVSDNYIPITRLDYVLSQLIQLKHLSLHLSGNDQFPSSICQLHQLRSLEIGIWATHVMPEWLNQLKHLEILWISAPELDHPLPLEAWLELPKLKELQIRLNDPYPIDPELLQRFEQRGVKVDLG
ncbi:leucine-rich repeat domain-containing protein [Herpetosiphon geysericola]|uniref:Disease resistance R13L4/SHOC-2-like LRR domain-containing protein n=1 Tax=Herpetosiphon geysericola TaxID=70996 RepID=A0A0P6Y448_9CHLR|nr:hypothetical protein [Herpetosiphon geysericola]KPL86691.1 hypothetical protein SE18_11940 [Herpetosiphon geysericola]